MTERKMTGITLDVAEYQYLVDQLPDVVLIVTDRDMHSVLAGGGALARAGWRAGELLGRRPQDLLPEPVAGQVAGHLASALRGVRTIMPVLPGTRSQLVWEARFGPLCGRDGAVKGVIFLLRDVTGRHRLSEGLRQSAERIRVALGSAASGFANVGLDGRFLQVNRRFCEITGYSEEELLARRYQDITHPDDMEVHAVQARQVISGEIPWYSVEKRYIRKDGTVVWVLITVGALRDDEGDVYEYVDTITDITARKHAQEEVARLNAELEERVRQRTAELEEANRNLEAFTYTVSHDLRAPLTALLGFSELLSEECGASMSGGAQEYVARIEAVGEHMSTLIDDLLSLSQASRAGIHLTTVDLSELARAAIAGLRGHDPDRKVEVSVASGVHALGDERLLRTVMENLLGNAWKFTSKTADAVIEFGTIPADGAVVHCFVSDNGAGFDPADAGSLFRPFTRLHAGTDFPGTGVGLASVQRIVARHHGRCWAEGQLGHGASFHFTLPAAPAGAGRP